MCINNLIKALCVYILTFFSKFHTSFENSVDPDLMKQADQDLVSSPFIIRSKNMCPLIRSCPYTVQSPMMFFVFIADKQWSSTSQTSSGLQKLLKN